MGTEDCGDYNACKLARIYIAKGDRVRAEQMYRAALKKNPWEAYEVIRYLNINPQI